MFFYVDESGHTGTNLFDEAQPTLYYGLLSSPVHLDFVIEPRLASLRKRLDVPRLHAAELGNGMLALIAGDLVDLQKRLRLRFDFYRVVKPDYAVICFFDQVFDQVMNPAVTWTGYWTPLRYVLLTKLAYLFDHELAKLAWAARINVDDKVADSQLVTVCEALRDRVGNLPDARSRQLIGDALTWAIAHPREISYNVETKEQILQVSPNLIGFQSVMHGIARRLRTVDRVASRIVVDQQSQFNKSQRNLAQWYASASGVRMPMGVGLPEVNFQGMPQVPIEVKAGTESAGLELVDIYLWIFKRWFENRGIAPELYPLVSHQFGRGYTDEVSLQAIIDRWTQWNDEAAEISEISAEQLEKARGVLAADEGRRMQALLSLKDR
jgi:hypothetical protein